MNWTVEWTERARKDLRGLTSVDVERVRSGVRRVAQDDRRGVKRLSGRRELRLRVGDLRVLFLLEQEISTLRVLRVLPREDAYRLQLDESP